jgi:ATP synthase protein I
VSEDLKRRIDKLKKGESKAPMEKLSFPNMAFRASVDMISGVVVGTGLGYFVDQYFGTDPWILLVGFLFGSAAGFFNVYRTVKNIERRDKPEKERQEK